MTDKMDEFVKMTARANAPTPPEHVATIATSSPGIGDNSKEFTPLPELAKQINQHIELVPKREYTISSLQLSCF